MHGFSGPAIQATSATISNSGVYRTQKGKELEAGEETLRSELEDYSRQLDELTKKAIAAVASYTDLLSGTPGVKGVADKIHGVLRTPQVCLPDIENVARPGVKQILASPTRCSSPMRTFLCSSHQAQGTPSRQTAQVGRRIIYRQQAALADFTSS